MAADGAHFLLTNDQIWERHPFSSLSVTRTSDFELRDVKTGKARLCHKEVSSYHPCGHRDLVIRRATNRTAFSFFLFFFKETLQSSAFARSSRNNLLGNISV